MLGKLEKLEKKRSKSSPPKVKPTRSNTLPVMKPKSKKSPPTRTKGGDVINLAPLISAVLLAAAKLSLENKKNKAKSAAPASAKSRTRSR